MRFTDLPTIHSSNRLTCSTAAMARSTCATACRVLWTAITVFDSNWTYVTALDKTTLHGIAGDFFPFRLTMDA